MPLFERQLNESADYIVRDEMTAWLHLAPPTDANPDNGRTTVGGGAYEAGVAVPAANMSVAANGDVSNTVEVEFGTADEDVGEVVEWSTMRGNFPVAHGLVPRTTISSGDSFSINVGGLQINGNTT